MLDRRECGKIIFIHGPSSSGKTTLSRALQQRLDEPFWLFSIDHLREAGVLPMERIRTGEFAWPKSEGILRRVPSLPPCPRGIGKQPDRRTHRRIPGVDEPSREAPFRLRCILHRPSLPPLGAGAAGDRARRSTHRRGARRLRKVSRVCCVRSRAGLDRTRRTKREQGPFILEAAGTTHCVRENESCEGLDLGEDRVIADAAHKADLDPSCDFLSAGHSGELRTEAAAGWRLAAERDRVFGVPSFVHAGRLYWGQDRMHFLRSAVVPQDGGSPVN